MANVDRDNMLNEEQESSQSNSSNGSGAIPQQQPLGSGGGGFQLKSSILRQPATFGSGAGAGGGLGASLFGSSSASGSSGPINSFNLKPSVLKPSHFGGGFGGSANQEQNNSSNCFGSNPFLKTQVSEEDSSDQQQQQQDCKDGGTEDNGDPLAKLKSLPRSNLFANVKSISENTGFVFGQNVHERVTGENVQSSAADGATPTAGLSFSSTVVAGAATNNSSDSSSSNSATGTSGGTTGASATNAGDASAAKSDPAGGEESLEEAARKYEESRGALKRKFDEVETITGEEDERNVVEVNCKLFAFAKSNWEERGHGTLRLNDADNKESRVVFRQAGNLRVLINTKVWSGMTADQSSQKSLRLTAQDNNGQVKVFLVMSRPDVIGKLHKELTKRIQTAKDLALETASDGDDGKENNDDNISSAAVAAKLSDEDDGCDEQPHPPAVVPGADSDEPSAKKRLSASSP